MTLAVKHSDGLHWLVFNFGRASAMRLQNLDALQWGISSNAGLGSYHVRHALTRRAFMRSITVLAGATAGVSLIPAVGWAAEPSNAAPVPTSNSFVANGLTFHVSGFGPGLDASSINDFNGFVGVADVQGTGTGTNPDGSTETLLYDTDMRFMNGVYVGQDGAVHKGAFGFV